MCRRVFFDDTILERESVFILCSFFLVFRSYILHTMYVRTQNFERNRLPKMKCSSFFLLN